MNGIREADPLVSACALLPFADGCGPGGARGVLRVAAAAVSAVWRCAAAEAVWMTSLDWSCW